MMKLETETTTSKRTKCVELACDLCGRKAERPQGRDWATNWMDIAKTAVSIKRGFAGDDNEGGHSETVEFDICPSCFETVLAPFLQSKGAKPRLEEVEW